MYAYNCHSMEVDSREIDMGQCIPNTRLYFCVKKQLYFLFLDYPTMVARDALALAFCFLLAFLHPSLLFGPFSATLYIEVSLVTCIWRCHGEGSCWMFPVCSFSFYLPKLIRRKDNLDFRFTFRNNQRVATNLARREQ